MMMDGGGPVVRWSRAATNEEKLQLIAPEQISSRSLQLSGPRENGALTGNNTMIRLLKCDPSSINLHKFYYILNVINVTACSL